MTISEYIAEAIKSGKTVKIKYVKLDITNVSINTGMNKCFILVQ